MSCTFASAARTACGNENIKVRLQKIPSFCSCSAALNPSHVEAILINTRLRGSINQTWVRRRILRLELFHRFKVRRIGNDFGELFNLLELIQLRLFFFGNSTAHNWILHLVERRHASAWLL